jgi:hypothetical protein
LIFFKKCNYFIGVTVVVGRRGETNARNNNIMLLICSSPLESVLNHPNPFAGCKR